MQLSSNASKEVDVAIVSAKDSALENMISGNFSWAGDQAEGAGVKVLLPQMTVPTWVPVATTNSKTFQGIKMWRVPLWALFP